MQRFVLQDGAVKDNQTGLVWARDASISEFPLSWKEAFDFIGELNRSLFLSFDDWKLPNRRELFSLVSHQFINPCLPSGHPFLNILYTYYWTSTTCDRLPGQAWYIHFGGARVFKGLKDVSYMVWPVRAPGGSKIFETGQTRCYGPNGDFAPCVGSGQDGEMKSGERLRQPRFSDKGHTVMDMATGLSWTKNADCASSVLDWESAFQIVRQMNREEKFGFKDWRMPGITELESIVDMGRHSPALPDGHPFSDVRDFYWSSTTSEYDTDYAWALYLRDGGLGVGYKTSPDFHLWAVRGGGPQGLAS